MKKLNELKTRRQTWHDVELYGTHEEARAAGFALIYEDERGTVYGIRNTNTDTPHTFARVAFVPDPVNVQWYMAEAVDENKTHAKLSKATAEPATLREVIAETSPRVLKQLSDTPAFRFDYNKPHTVQRIRGTFTAAKLAKLTGDGATVSAVIIQTPDDSRRYWKFGRVCLFNGVKFEPIKIPHRSALDNFYAVGDINNARKICANAFIITQSEEHTRKKTFNGEYIGGVFLDASNRLAKLEERSRGAKLDTCGDGRGGFRYKKISGRLDNGGAAFSFEFSQWNAIYSTTPPAPFDVSGYYVAIKRDNLKRKAEQLRIDRAKAEAQAQDFTAEIAEAEAEITAARRSIMAALAAANNWREYQRAADAARLLMYAAQDFDILTEKAAARTFASIESACARVEDVKQYAARARAKLTEVNK